MYVKFVFYPEEGDVGGGISECIFDCSEVCFKYDKDNKNGGRFTMRNLPGKITEQIVDVTLTSAIIYVMNGEGKTIDRYSWKSQGDEIKRY